MITYLRVRNLAIVEELAIEPGPGLNVLTGETGAGKSLLIDSLGFLSGARGSTAMIRTGEQKMTAEAAFELPEALVPELEAAGIEVARSGGAVELIVRREITSEGRSRVLLNGSPVAVRELSATMDRIVEIHGQNESLDRIAGQSFREVLDAYAGAEPLVGEVRRFYAEWKAVSEELERLEGAARDRELRLDLLRHQIDEIAAARLERGEDEEMLEERTILANAQEMAEATSGAFTLVSDSENSAIALVARAAQKLAPLAKIVADVRAVHDELEEARIRLQESARSIAHLADSVRHDPRRLEQIEERLATLERLKKKYGSTIEEILAHLESIRAEHETLADWEASTGKLRKREDEALDRYREAAALLSAERRKTASRLQHQIERELRDLAMDGTTVEVRLRTAGAAGSRLTVDGQTVAFGAEGWDRVEIWIAANRGEELRPIQKSASGGELSRIQLAIAAALFEDSERSAGATLVFDEIDAGIGGRVADAVGAKLRQLARANQVVCVTHLPQIAGFGTTHFRVWKEESNGRTLARVERLDETDARVREIARMLGGSETSAAAHARELLARHHNSSRKRSERRRATG
ncbi:MAG: DNA repair protein RecN [Thermoanaerobaculia bacterium]